MNRRKKYTQMVLKDSVIKLLTDKQISTITVKEICEYADINRSTFYSHYSDQYDLLSKIEQEIIEGMNEKLHTYHDTVDEVTLTEKIIEYISEKKETFLVLLTKNNDPTFQKQVMNVVNQFLFKVKLDNKAIDEDTLEYLSLFIISGCIQVITCWLRNEMDKTQKEMAEMITNFANKGLSSLSS